MDDNHAPDHGPDAGPDRTAEHASDRTGEPAPDRIQERLPLEAAGGAIPFELTAKARRAVAPDSLPDLAVVDPDLPGDADGSGRGPDGGDETNRARARALRRAGMGWEEIAGELGVDVLLVRAWVEGVAPVRSARRREHTSEPDRGGRDDRAGHDTAAHRTFTRKRAAARDEADRRLSADPAFAAGVGLLTGAVELSAHALTLTGADPEVAAASLAWLRSATEVDPGRIRVVLRLAPAVAGDRAARRWAAALGVAVERITTTRWSAAPAADATAALIRVADPGVAGTAAGWRDALLAAGGGSRSPARGGPDRRTDAPAVGA